MIIPDRFAQSPGGEFVESKGRERDHPFGDAVDYSTIMAFAFLFGFTTYSDVLEQLTGNVILYPSVRIRETYFDGGTHEVLISTTGDPAPNGDIYDNITYEEISGTYQTVPVGAPITIIDQTELTQTRRMGTSFCTATNTLEGDIIPIQDFLHELYRLHKPLSDFNIPVWRMVRNAVHNLIVIPDDPAPFTGTGTLAGSVVLVRGSMDIYGPNHVDRNLACGVVSSGVPMYISKTLLPANNGFSDWIVERRVLGGVGASYDTRRCIHAPGIELLQPPPVEMTDVWFDEEPLGKFVTVDHLELYRWAGTIIPPPSPASLYVDALPVCTA